MKSNSSSRLRNSLISFSERLAGSLDNIACNCVFSNYSSFSLAAFLVYSESAVAGLYCAKPSFITALIPKFTWSHDSPVLVYKSLYECVLLFLATHISHKSCSNPCSALAPSAVFWKSSSVHPVRISTGWVDIFCWKKLLRVVVAFILGLEFGLKFVREFEGFIRGYKVNSIGWLFRNFSVSRSKQMSFLMVSIAANSAWIFRF